MSANGKHTAVLSVENVSHSFGDVVALSNVRFSVQHGEFVSIVGPSGCGKTTLLHLLSGTYQPSMGRLERNGRTKTVYQQDGLFPWLTAAENISLGLRELPEARRKGELEDLLRLIRLEKFAGHYPHQLSGGMKQRVELARALAGESETLLLDEPFSALDYQTRIRMRRELVRLLEERPRTVIFVTHDIEEATQLADRVLVLTERPGRICKELVIDRPRPRTSTDPVVVDAIRQILELLGLEREGLEDAVPLEI
jgi:ABC-type nitrate/sulfonate/bicarbonate transport system ATPase subunit